MAPMSESLTGGFFLLTRGVPPRATGRKGAPPMRFLGTPAEGRHGL